MIDFSIKHVDESLEPMLQNKIDFKTKPTGSLGVLEIIAKQIGKVQNSLEPQLLNPHLIVFAADHGLAKEGVSAYPQEVTHQMVLNFLGGGAGISVFCKQNDIKLKVVDSGVNHDFGTIEGIIDKKVGNGTNSSLGDNAMTNDQMNQAIRNGANVVKENVGPDCNIIGFGEMGIGNTSSASLIMHYLTEIPLNQCIGKGTGLEDDQLAKKLRILENVVSHHGAIANPEAILKSVGGYEIAQMTGAFLQAASEGKIVMVDGFIATAAFAVAAAIQPQILDYAIFSHQSDESGHAAFLQYLKAKPILNLSLRLGEGTGCALAYPIVKSAVAFLNQMASFEEASVSNKAEA